jgi:hypothetical protein
MALFGDATDEDVLLRARVHTSDKVFIGAKMVPGDDGVEDFDIPGVTRQLEDPTTVRELAEMEHRRWCAERLMAGWRPLPERLEGEWAGGKEARAAFKAQKLHIDLNPFDQLSPDEQKKDFSQIRGTPDYMRNASARRRSAPPC